MVTVHSFDRKFLLSLDLGQQKKCTVTVITENKCTVTVVVIAAP